MSLSVNDARSSRVGATVGPEMVFKVDEMMVNVVKWSTKYFWPHLVYEQDRP